MWTFIIDTVHLAYLKWRPCLRFRSQNSGRMQTLIGKLLHRGYRAQRMRSYCFSLWSREIKVITLQRHHLGVVATTTIENYARPFVVMGELMNKLVKKLAHILPPIKINLQRYIRNTHHLSRFFSCGTKKTLMPINLWPFFEPLKCPLAPLWRVL